MASPATAAAQSAARSNEEVRGLKRQVAEMEGRVRELLDDKDAQERQSREHRNEAAKLKQLLSMVQGERDVLQAKLAAEKDEHNRGVLRVEVDDVMVGEHLIATGGLSRMTITSSEWHANNPRAAKHLFGFDSWHETRHYIWAFWPNLDQRPVRSASSDITEFEKCLIARIRIRRRYEEGSLALIWGRSRTSINRYIGEWAPQWGLMGRVLSELSIDEKYLQATCPAAYRSVGHGGVGSLLDGKDFLVESERKNNAIKNAQWSNKSSKSAFRVIVWSTPSGLIFEKTCAFLGRPSEGRLVRLWRSRLRKIPAGWSVLADRGFANDARLYPNLNAHVTPHFLRPRQRTQFESAEVGNDQELSMLRYTSETIFSRVTDEKILTDVVPYSAFSIFQHAYDWACGNANLRKKFTHPEVDRRLALRAGVAP